MRTSLLPVAIGRTGLERVLLGSTSERILNETPCAVLVVKAS
ncbi:MAG: universal stress protein [Gammaproteobacteria bacterium]